MVVLEFDVTGKPEGGDDRQFEVGDVGGPDMHIYGCRLEKSARIIECRMHGVVAGVESLNYERTVGRDRAGNTRA